MPRKFCLAEGHEGAHIRANAFEYTRFFANFFTLRSPPDESQNLSHHLLMGPFLPGKLSGEDVFE